jgi:hypothetical protein
MNIQKKKDLWLRGLQNTEFFFFSKKLELVVRAYLWINQQILSKNKRPVAEKTAAGPG